MCNCVLGEKKCIFFLEKYIHYIIWNAYTTYQHQHVIYSVLYVCVCGCITALYTAQLSDTSNNLTLKEKELTLLKMQMITLLSNICNLSPRQRKSPGCFSCQQSTY